MKRLASVVAGAVLLAVASGALAGEHKKCTLSVEECKAKMKAKIAAKGWLGVELDKNDANQMVVKEVVPASPAAAAGFQKGDVVVAVNGIDYSSENEADKAKLKEAWAPGKKATFTVKREGAKKDLAVELTKVPDEVAAKWIQEHMKEQHAEAMKEKAPKS